MGFQVPEDMRVRAHAWRGIHDRKERVHAMKSRFFRDLQNEVEAVTSKYQTESREPSDAEILQLEALAKEKRALRDELREATGTDPRDSIRDLALTDINRTGPIGSGGGRLMGYDADGTPIKIVGPRESFAAAIGASSSSAEGALGRIVRGQVTGNYGGLDVNASMAGAGTTSGGVFLAPDVLARVIDLARAKSRVVQAGAQTIPMEARDLTICKVATEPVPQWRGENQQITLQDLTFAGVKLQARTVAILSSVPVELVEDSANIGQIVETVISEAIAAEFDRAALLGAGSAEEPRGLKNTPGVGSAGSIGSPLWDDLIDAMTTVRLANGEPNAVILSPRDLGTLTKLKGTANDHYLTPPDDVRNLMRLATSKIPTNLGGGTNESIAFLGDFSWLWLGVRTELRIEASREAATSPSTSAFANLTVAIRGYLRCDVAVIRPSHFVQLSGIL